MSESEYDSANEYTSLMDGHVAESRTEDLILGNHDRRKNRSRNTSEEVIFSTNFCISLLILFLLFYVNRFLLKSIV